MYNITNWKPKQLNNLIISIDQLRPHIEDTLKYPEEDEDIVRFVSSALDYSIIGKISDDKILVSELILYGEGSGTIFHRILIPALRKSTGELEAVIVWEGGDEITRLTVKDGKVNEDLIEL